MNDNLNTLIILVTLLHVVAMAVMLVIRFKKTAGDGIVIPPPKITPCAVCGEPSTDWVYDGRDPHEQRDSTTGKAWSADITHYQPVCAAHVPCDTHSSR